MTDVADETPQTTETPAEVTAPAAPVIPEGTTTLLRLACGDVDSVAVPCSTAPYCPTHGLSAVVGAAEYRGEE